MAKINILDSSVYNLISAGEVVERPASVVKELVENAIDAGAKNITVEIKDGGKSLIKISDDGSGIEEDDVKSAFLPHATSKIKNADDLDSILTLGFRGEALASIASVAKVRLMSKTSEAEIGNEITIEGGKFGEKKQCSTKNGTTIEVQDLFFCVPARAKFLKKNKTEEQEITNIMTRTILANPRINFSYIIDGKKSLSSLGQTSKEAMFSIYGKEAVSETLPVHAERDGVVVSGFVGKPTYSKSNRTYQTLIVNGRYVVNLTVQTAVSNAYGDFLMKRQYPFFILYLNVPAHEIDVNVHPNKLDVKFLKSSTVYSVVFEAVSKALYQMDYIKNIDSETNANIIPNAHNNSIINENTESLNLTNSGANFSNSTTQKTNLSFSNSTAKSSSKIDKAGVNLNPFSTNFDAMSENEKEKLNDIVIDSMISVSNDGSVRDNFGLGSKLLERINEKVSSNDKDAYKSQNYEVGEKKTSQNQNNTQKEPAKSVNYDDEIKIQKSEDTLETEFNKSSYDYETQKNKTLFVKHKSVQEDFAENEMRIVGKFFNTYLAIEWGDNIYLIDQHAGHERLNYEKFKAQYETKSIAVQPMLVPYVLSLNSEDSQVLEANLEVVRSVGFEIDEFGENTYKISSVPAIVSSIDFNKFFSMFLAEKLNKSKITEAELVKDSLMQMACKSAVKGGDDLTKDEVNKLLYEMSKQNVTLFCPHGRPIVVRITKAEIEKWFKRIV